MTRSILALALALIGSGAAFSQEGPIVIRSVDFQVQGRSLSFVLMQKINANGPIIGQSFADEAALEAFLGDRAQVLLNTRLFVKVEPSYDLVPGATAGSDAAVHFEVVDTWNIVALPKPNISPNTGVDLYLKAKDYNFLGSMQTLSLSPDVKWDTHGNLSGSVATSFTVPFRTFSADWSLGVGETFQYWNASTILSDTTTSLTYNIPGLSFPASITAGQGYFYNADVQYPDYPEPDPFYLSESLSGTAHLPIGLSLGSFGMVYYDPTLSVTEDWWPTAAMNFPGRNGPSFYFGNLLSTGRLDWIGNMRQGASISLMGATSYTAVSQDFIGDLNLSLLGAWHYKEHIGVTARLVALGRPLGNFTGGPPPLSAIFASLPISNDYMTGLGSNMRGIVDNRIVGVGGLFANVSVPIKLFDFPTHIVIKKNWLDFELQAQPFVDAALVLPSWDQRLGSGNLTQWLWASGGLEFLFFPVFMRNFIVRAGWGWDLLAVAQNHSLTAPAKDGQSSNEYFLGTGLAY